MTSEVSDFLPPLQLLLLQVKVLQSVSSRSLVPKTPKVFWVLVLQLLGTFLLIGPPTQPLPPPARQNTLYGGGGEARSGEWKAESGAWSVGVGSSHHSITK